MRSSGTTDSGEKVTYRLFSGMAAFKAALDLTPDRDGLVSLRPKTQRAFSDAGWILRHPATTDQRGTGARKRDQLLELSLLLPGHP